MVDAQRLLELRRRGLVHEVHLQDGDAIDRIGRQQVDSGDRCLGRPAAYHLAPSARRNAEIDHRL